MLNGVNLASFSLVDCAQTLLGQRLEVVPNRHLASWAGLNSSEKDTQWVMMDIIVPHSYLPHPPSLLSLLLPRAICSFWPRGRAHSGPHRVMKPLIPIDWFKHAARHDNLHEQFNALVIWSSLLLLHHVIAVLANIHQSMAARTPTLLSTAIHEGIVTRQPSPVQADQVVSLSDIKFQHVAPL